MDSMPTKTIADVISDFLSSAPSLEELAEYKLPAEFQERAHYLLEKNREGKLTDAEEAEISAFRQIDHIITLFKAKAERHLNLELPIELQTLLNEYLKWYFILRGKPCFTSIDLIIAFETIPNGEGDEFFEKYGVGNALFAIEKPYERLKAYELLLYILKEYNREKYDQIHKGVPYYFIGWLAFRIENFRKGLFYIDAAVSEDIKKSRHHFDITASHLSPAIRFFRFDKPEKVVGSDLFDTMIDEIKKAMEKYSNTNNSGHHLTLESFRDKFLSNTELFQDGSFRSVLAGLYGFILEAHLRRKMIDLRSSEGGAIEPFLSHLFSGGLVLESLLKLKVPNNLSRLTLNKAIKTLKTDLDLSQNFTLTSDIAFTDIADILKKRTKAGDSFQDICFDISFCIRNTTGHELSWSDVFKDDKTLYEKLHERILGAIFWSRDVA